MLEQMSDIPLFESDRIAWGKRPHFHAVPAPHERMSGQQAQSMPEQTPLSDMSEQCLRSLPQDPGGLMRRKFRYQSKIRARDNSSAAAGEKRY